MTPSLSCITFAWPETGHVDPGGFKLKALWWKRALKCLKVQTKKP